MDVRVAPPAQTRQGHTIGSGGVRAHERHTRTSRVRWGCFARLVVGELGQVVVYDSECLPYTDEDSTDECEDDAGQ